MQGTNAKFRAAIRECTPETAAVDLSLLELVSPIDWGNVVLYGQYVRNRKLIKRRRAVAAVFPASLSDNVPARAPWSPSTSSVSNSRGGSATA